VKAVVVVVVGALLLMPGGVPRLAAAGDSQCVVIEDFQSARIGAFPAAWKPRKDAGRRVYSVQEEGGLRFLRAVAQNVGIQAGFEFSWDLVTHPTLAWSWRVRRFPDRADEREGRRNDSAVAVYAIFPLSSFAVKAVKYIWSERVPVGSHLTSNHGLTQVRVLETGPERRGEWVDEQVNVAEDYRRYFGDGDLPRPAGIAVLTDSDDTHSRAEGDYARFRACRS
jgi:hypothetical protein